MHAKAMIQPPQTLRYCPELWILLCQNRHLKFQFLSPDIELFYLPAQIHLTVPTSRAFLQAPISSSLDLITS